MHRRCLRRWSSGSLNSSSEVNSLFIEMNMPRQSFWTVGACVIMFTRSSVRVAWIKKTPVWRKPGGSPREEEADAYSLVSLAWASTSPDFSPVTVFTKKYLKKTFGLPAEGVPHLASHFALMPMAVATGVAGSSKAAALL